MQFIITNEKGEEVTLLTDKQYIDIEIGEGRNNFSIQIDKNYQKKWGINTGWWIGCPGTEYGGIIDGIQSVNETIVFTGMTWRGLLMKKIIEPPTGQDYLVVSGYAHNIINDVSCSQFDGIFVCSGSSGITFNNFQFDRYVSHLDGFEKMLLSKNAKIEFAYNSGESNGKAFVSIKAVPIIDYSDEIEYSKDGALYYIYFSFKRFTGGINHLICLGKGELKDRLVIHLYVQQDGTIGNEKYYTGKDEKVAIYDYSNAESAEELSEKGIERLKELMSYVDMDINLYNSSLERLTKSDIKVGDIVGGRDFDTGIYLRKQISKKIIEIKNGKETIEYKVGGSASSV